jgi:hypothetical protein
VGGARAFLENKLSTPPLEGGQDDFGEVLARMGLHGLTGHDAHFDQHLPKALFGIGLLDGRFILLAGDEVARQQKVAKPFVRQIGEGKHQITLLHKDGAQLTVAGQAQQARPPCQM